MAIGRNHPFQQGNKRTAFAVAAAFLDINSHLLSADTLQFADLFVSVLERRSGVDDLIEAMGEQNFEIIES